MIDWFIFGRGVVIYYLFKLSEIHETFRFLAKAKQWIMHLQKLITKTLESNSYGIIAS